MLWALGGRGHANDVNGMGEVTSPFCAALRPVWVTGGGGSQAELIPRVTLAFPAQ